jgi:hypothetical protein
MLRRAAQAPYRRRPLSSNVRQHSNQRCSPRLLSRQSPRIPNALASASMLRREHASLRLKRHDWRVCEARPSQRASRGTNLYRSPRCLKVSPWSRRHPEDSAFVQHWQWRRIGTVGSGSSHWRFRGQSLSHSPPGYQRLSATRVLPNPSLERTRNGMAPWPRGAVVHVAPRGQGATPSSAAQLKR